MVSKRRIMFYKNKKQQTTEIGTRVPDGVATTDDVTELEGSWGRRLPRSCAGDLQGPQIDYPPLLQLAAAEEMLITQYTALLLQTTKKAAFVEHTFLDDPIRMLHRHPLSHCANIQALVCVKFSQYECLPTPRSALSSGIDRPNIRWDVESIFKGIVHLTQELELIT
ncbi:hypothetical protein AAG570_008562 [Ranatra chinensis]|uniref:Uncharacterized protein n=1 Tax=Ranatra chinensis TaxID=642074 RepID=A0ABD0YTF3_9HEMI